VLQAHGVPSAVASAGPERALLEHEQVVANGWVAALEHPTLGRLGVAHRWLDVSQPDVGCNRPSPRLGEHTAQVLAELGYSNEAIADLAERGAVACLPEMVAAAPAPQGAHA
jgi:crotonobetainyl-CoA:carnitine CoA-transferase CaiB-like acyl-CoA transferase